MNDEDDLKRRIKKCEDSHIEVGCVIVPLIVFLVYVWIALNDKIKDVETRLEVIEQHLKIGEALK